MNGKRKKTPLEEALAPHIEEAQQKERKNANPANPSPEPFTCLGQNGKYFVYWVRRNQSILELTPEKHNLANLFYLAPKEYWAQKCGENWRMNDAADYCFEHQGTRRYSHETIRGIGIWNEKGKPLYNAGDACFMIEGGEIAEVDNIRDGGNIYDRQHPASRPEEPSLSNDEASTILRFLSAHAWQELHAGRIVAGLMIQGLLSGFLNFRAHGWINAPAGSGKSELRKEIENILGKNCLSMEGAESTEASIRQRAGNSAMPILWDEAEQRGGRSTEGAMNYIRSCTTAGDIYKGGADGKAKRYTAQSSFILFSINNPICRDSDATRILVLHMRKLEGEALQTLLVKKRECRTRMKENITPGRLINRILRLAPVIRENAQRIEEYIRDHGHAGRRSELFGVILAGAYALESESLMEDNELKTCLEIVNHPSLAPAEENDSTNCFARLLDHIPQGSGYSIREWVQTATREGIGKTDAEDMLARHGMRVLKGEKGLSLFVYPRHTQILHIMKGTDWEKGCSETLRHLHGADDAQRKIMGKNVRGLIVPWYHIATSEDELSL